MKIIAFQFKKISLLIQDMPLQCQEKVLQFSLHICHLNFRVWYYNGIIGYKNIMHCILRIHNYNSRILHFDILTSGYIVLCQDVA